MKTPCMSVRHRAIVNKWSTHNQKGRMFWMDGCSCVVHAVFAHTGSSAQFEQLFRSRIVGPPSSCKECDQFVEYSRITSIPFGLLALIFILNWIFTLASNWIYKNIKNKWTLAISRIPKTHVFDSNKLSLWPRDQNASSRTLTCVGDISINFLRVPPIMMDSFIIVDFTRPNTKQYT